MLEQLEPLMAEYDILVEVGPSEQDIPYPYVVSRGMNWPGRA